MLRCERKGVCSAFAEAAKISYEKVEAVGRQPDRGLTLFANLTAARRELTNRQGERGVALGTLEADRQFHNQLPCKEL